MDFAGGCCPTVVSLQSRRELHENRLVSIEQSITRLEKHFQGSIKTVRDGLKEASEVRHTCAMLRVEY